MSLLRWLLRWKPYEFRITRYGGDVEGVSAVYYVEVRGGWRRRWARISWAQKVGIKRGFDEADYYTNYVAAQAAKEEIRAYFGSSDQNVVSGPLERPQEPDEPPPPAEPPDLKALITRARTHALKDSVVQVLADAVQAVDNLNRFAWDGDEEAVWAVKNRVVIASMFAHASATLEAMLGVIRDIETELAMRETAPVPMPTLMPVRRRPPRPPTPVAWPEPAVSAPMADFSTAPPFNPLQELRDAGAAKSGILDLGEGDVPTHDAGPPRDHGGVQSPGAQVGGAQEARSGAPADGAQAPTHEGPDPATDGGSKPSGKSLSDWDHLDWGLPPRIDSAHQFLSEYDAQLAAHHGWTLEDVRHAYGIRRG